MAAKKVGRANGLEWHERDDVEIEGRILRIKCTLAMVSIAFQAVHQKRSRKTVWNSRPSQWPA